MNPCGRIAAFFDLDGTLLAPPSLEWRFIGYLLGRDELGGRNLARWLEHCANTLLRNPRAATEGNKFYLAGLPESLVADWADSHAAWDLPFFPQGIARMAWHHAQQHQVFLVTGTLAPHARAILPQLPEPVEVCATELESIGSHWTGSLAGCHITGEAKARAIRAIAERYNLDLARSFAYGNTVSDRAMLEAVGHPVAVNPSMRLAGWARKRGWSISRWDRPQATAQAAAQTARKNLLAQEHPR